MASSAPGIPSCAMTINSAPHPLFFLFHTKNALLIAGEWNSKPNIKQIQRFRKTSVDVAGKAELLRLNGSCDQRQLLI